MAEESTNAEPPALAVDVPALTALLDGRYADIRRTVRELLPAYASVLEDAETLPRAEFRERVKDVVLEMAGTGATGMGFPKEYDGGGDIGASIAAFETLAYGDLSVLVPASLSRTLSEVHQEGIRIPPTKIVRKGVVNQEILNVLLANVRMPEQNWGDLKAQIAALPFTEPEIEKALAIMKQNTQKAAEKAAEVVD